jgi:hypothetical protein
VEFYGESAALRAAARLCVDQRAAVLARAGFVCLFLRSGSVHLCFLDARQEIDLFPVSTLLSSALSNGVVTLCIRASVGRSLASMGHSGLTSTRSLYHIPGQAAMVRQTGSG